MKKACLQLNKQRSLYYYLFSEVLRHGEWQTTKETLAIQRSMSLAILSRAFLFVNFYDIIICQYFNYDGKRILLRGALFACMASLLRNGQTVKVLSVHCFFKN